VAWVIFYVYTPVFFCQDKNGGEGIAMWREKLEKMESFGTGDALGRYVCEEIY
jgi:hypothetical protein